MPLNLTFNNPNNSINNPNNSILGKVTDFVLAPARSFLKGHPVFLRNKANSIPFKEIVSPKLECEIVEEKQKIDDIQYSTVQYESKDENSINKIFYEHITNGLVKELYEDICNNPLNYIQFNEGPAYKKFFFPPLEFFECACIKGTFNRFLNSRRVSIEKAIVSDLKVRLPIEAPISLLSMGSGGLFQDFILIGKLIQAGYKSISLTLVDPEIDETKVTSLKNFLKNFDDVKIEIRSFKNVNQLSQEEKFNTIYAIDYDEFENHHIQGAIDALASLKLLDSNGQFFLSYGKNDYVWNEKDEFKYMQGGSRSAVVSSVSKKIKSFLSKRSNEPLEVGVFSNTSPVFPPLMGLLKAMKKCPKDQVINIKLLKFEDEWTWYTSDVEKTHRFITLLFEKYKNLKVEIIDDLENDKNSFDLYFDVSFAPRNVTRNNEKTFLKQSGIGFIQGNRGMGIYTNE